MRKMMNECIVATVIESKNRTVENEGMEDWMDKNDYDLHVLGECHV